jgi:hypothetical protein
MRGEKQCYPSCVLCEGCGEVTAVWDGHAWRIVPATQAHQYKQKGRTTECPNLRFAPVSLERPLIEIE